MGIRIVFFVTLLILSTMVPFGFFLVGTVFYGFFWGGYELIVLAACIDAYFGSGSGIPEYLLSVSVIVLAIEWLRPSLLIYNV